MFLLEELKGLLDLKCYDLQANDTSFRSDCIIRKNVWLSIKSFLFLLIAGRLIFNR